MNLANVSDQQLEGDAEDLDDRAGISTGLADIAFFQRCAAVLRAYVAERKARDAAGHRGDTYAPEPEEPAA